MPQVRITEYYANALKNDGSFSERDSLSFRVHLIISEWIEQRGKLTRRAAKAKAGRREDDND